MTAAGPASRLRILTQADALAPLGGVEISTLQDALALVGRGHDLAVVHGPDGSLRGDYERAGIALEGPQPFGWSPRTALRDTARFLPAARWARARGTDVVWLNRVEHLPWAQLVSRSAGAGLVCHLHNQPSYQRMRLVGTGVAHFVAVSDLVRRAYVDRGIDPSRITLLPNALPPGEYPVGGDAERTAARQALGLPADVPVVLSYSQLTAGKGAPTLLRAWSRVSADVPDALLVLVDVKSHDPDPAVHEQLGRLDPRSYRLFPATADVVPYLHAADVVAFPTELPETFGRVVLEGMATGRPVVASRIGAVPELLSGPMERFLVTPGAADELAAALTGLLDWRRTEPGLGAECVEWVDRRYPFDAHVAGLEAVLRAASRR